MTPDQIEALTAAVQANCDIADARHAADLSLCNFLLQMREFYRWQQGLGFDVVPDRHALGRWLAAREAAWAEVEEQPFAALPLAGQAIDPFELDRINAQLRPRGLVYGAGWAEAGRPAFFLAELLRLDESGPGPVVQHCGHELARGLFAPPAALQGGTIIVLRRESLARWLWERWEAFALHRPAGAFAALARSHGIGSHADFIAGLPRLVDEAGEVLRLHEWGEYRAAQWLEPGWAALRTALTDRRATLQLRAVRDLIADCSLTLPTLLARGADDAIHFWFASFDGLREVLAPALMPAYAAWAAGDGDGGAALRAACAQGEERFCALARELLAIGEPAAVSRRLAETARSCL